MKRVDWSGSGDVTELRSLEFACRKCQGNMSITSVSVGFDRLLFEVLCEKCRAGEDILLGIDEIADHTLQKDKQMFSPTLKVIKSVSTDLTQQINFHGDID